MGTTARWPRSERSRGTGISKCAYGSPSQIKFDGSGLVTAEVGTLGGVRVAETGPSILRQSTVPAARFDSSRTPKLVIAVIISAYVALGLIALRPSLFGSSDRLFGTGADSILATWYLGWVPHALHNGVNPLFSHSIFAPKGVNLAQNTESPFLGLLSTPLALFAGPVARANILIVLAMPISAASAFLVLLRWRVWVPAAAIGGLIYGFSPYALGHLRGHLVLVFTPIPPLIALTIASIVQRRGSPIRLGTQLGLLVTAQFLTEPEIAVSVVIMAAWGVLYAAILYRREIVNRLWPSAKAIVVATCVASVFLAYPIWMLTAGPEHYSGTAQPVNNPYFNDLLSFVVPGPSEENSLGLSKLATHINTMNKTAEMSGYIGVALIVIAIGLFWRSRNSKRMRLAAATLAGAAVLSLGSYLHVNGNSTHVPLPFLIASHVPLIDNVLASRFSFEIHACFGALIAFGIDDVRNTGIRTRKGESNNSRARIAVVLCLATLVVLIATQLPRWPIESQPNHRLPAAVVRAIPRSEPVAITYPYATPVFPQAMSWQMNSGYAFKLTGGYSMHPTPKGLPTGFPNPTTPAAFETFLSGQEGFNPYVPRQPITKQLMIDTRTTLARYDVRLIIVDRSIDGSGAVTTLLRSVLGNPSVTSGSFVAWVSYAKPL